MGVAGCINPRKINPDNNPQQLPNTEGRNGEAQPQME